MPALLPFHCYYFGAAKKPNKDSRSVRLREEHDMGKELLSATTDDREKLLLLMWRSVSIVFSVLKLFFITVSTFYHYNIFSSLPVFYIKLYSIKPHLYKEKINLEHTHIISLTAALSMPLY